MGTKNTTIDFVESLEVKKTKTKDKLFLAHLDSILMPNIDYLTLDDALEEDLVEIKERDDATVSDFKVKNKSDEMLLLIAGEQLQGEKQNRTVNTSILVGAKKEIIIPVSCTEQGRWAYTGKTDVASDYFLHSQPRVGLIQDVSSTLKSNKSYRGFQENVWGNAEQAATSYGVRSSTQSIDDIYKTYDNKVNKLFEQFQQDLLDYSGILGSNENLIILDAFTRKETLSKIRRKLVKSYILDSLNCLDVREMSKADIEDFLKNIREAKLDIYESPGLGESIRITKNDFSGSCLVYEGEVIHLSLFQQRKNMSTNSEISPPSKRYRRI